MGAGNEGYFEPPDPFHRQTSLVFLIWAGPHTVTMPLVTCVNWNEIALVCRWLSSRLLQLAAQSLNAGFSEKQKP